ncbi:hypothetical protein D5S17_06200 [Pseudonocardiaceae bacterium YIM PH 21723]|nr:hypothetical protein D5S17_06200 [Pseudonocardiaceae bacterium YIM PH 21723]
MDDLVNAAMTVPWLVAVIATVMIVLETSSVVGLLMFTDTALLAVGAVAGKGQLSLWLIMPLMIAAALLGDVLGVRHGDGRWRPGRDTWLSRTWKYYSGPAERILRYRNGVIIPIARIVPYVRTVIPISAGATGMDRRDYLRRATPGIVLWVVGVTLVGTGAGQVFSLIARHQSVVIATAVLAVLGVLATVFHRRLTRLFLSFATKARDPEHVRSARR